MSVQPLFKDRTDLVNELLVKIRLKDPSLSLPLKANLVKDASSIDLCDQCFEFFMTHLLTELSAVVNKTKREVEPINDPPTHCIVRDSSEVNFKINFVFPDYEP